MGLLRPHYAVQPVKTGMNSFVVSCAREEEQLMREYLEEHTGKSYDFTRGQGYNNHGTHNDTRHTTVDFGDVRDTELAQALLGEFRSKLGSVEI